MTKFFMGIVILALIILLVAGKCGYKKFFGNTAKIINYGSEILLNEK